MNQKHSSIYTGNLYMPKRSYKVLPLLEMVKDLDSIRENNSYAGAGKISG